MRPSSAKAVRSRRIVASDTPKRRHNSSTLAVPDSTRFRMAWRRVATFIDFLEIWPERLYTVFNEAVKGRPGKLPGETLRHLVSVRAFCRSTVQGRLKDRVFGLFLDRFDFAQQEQIIENGDDNQSGRKQQRRNE